MFNKYVKCETCKCLLNKNDAQEVRKVPFFSFKGDEYIYFCGSHKKSYDEIIETWYDNKYYAHMQVDKEGNPIGYKKIEVKK